MLSQTTMALFKRFVSVTSSLFIVICFKNLHFVKLVRLIESLIYVTSKRKSLNCRLF